MLISLGGRELHCGVLYICAMLRVLSNAEQRSGVLRVRCGVLCSIVRRQHQTGTSEFGLE
jgi:hypothetical protein